MQYEVIANFIDKEDNKRLYEVGQPYPREGHAPSEERIESLSTHNNNGNKPFIKLVEVMQDSDSEFPRHTGGGYFELSNGEKVKGKEAAEKAENDLKGE